MKLKIEELGKICVPENIEITLYAAKRLEQRNISLNDIIFCIHEGEIIEQYPDDYPYPSCLILGFSMKKKYIHVVIGTDLETLWIITAYYPNLDKWKQDLRTRRED